MIVGFDHRYSSQTGYEGPKSHRNFPQTDEVCGESECWRRRLADAAERGCQADARAIPAAKLGGEVHRLARARACTRR